MRFLSGRRVRLSHTFLDDEQVLTPASVSVSVTASDGTEVYADADVTLVGEEYPIDVGFLPQGVYRVVWTSVDAIDTEYVEVVGANLFTVPEARDSDSELSDTADYPAGELLHYREVVESEFETVTGRSFVPRTVSVAVETDGTDTVWTGLFDCHSLVSLTGPDGELVASDYHLAANGLLSGLEGLCEGTRLTATIDYGFRSCPPDVKRVGLTRLRFLLAAESSGIPDRATSYVAAEGGTFTLATPGRGGYKIGIPEVDAVLNLYTYSVLFDVLGA